ncbi:hypothetical protein CRG98_022472 [Punica granatum]|uniref:Uncharacterized protein n=1 Tax=Punica granatum TaxID=22663 RepID=A0A2I0JLM0_PUNGR|nr:hypothetical protein CRG98_022472 [Punica granatum]
MGPLKPSPRGDEKGGREKSRLAEPTGCSWKLETRGLRGLWLAHDQDLIFHDPNIGAVSARKVISIGCFPPPHREVRILSPKAKQTTSWEWGAVYPHSKVHGPMQQGYLMTIATLLAKDMRCFSPRDIKS